MMPPAAVETVLADESDLDDVGTFLIDLGGPLFFERFPGKTPADFYRWKYFTNPEGPALIATAKSGSRIVSTVAAMPKRLYCDGEYHLVYELGDFLTAPDHRKQGLFSRLIELVCAEGARREAAFAYVRPNDNSFPILEKHLGFQELRWFDNRRLVAPSAFLARRTGIAAGTWQATGLDALMRAVLLGRNGGGVECRRTERFDGADTLWEQVSRQYRFAVARSQAYLDWRYVECPTPFRVWTAFRSGRVAGHAATFLNQDDPLGFVADVFTAPDDAVAARTLVSTVVRDLLDGGARAVYTWTLNRSDESHTHAALVRACPLRDADRMHFAVRFLDGRWNAERLPASGWRLALGEFDGI